jgi:lysophospholipase L1-like esterase
MQELVDYEPDLFVVYVGHNEFLEDRTYGKIKRTPHAVARTHEGFSKFRTYNVLRSLVPDVLPGKPVPQDRATLEAEVAALLDYRGGMESYHHDEDWHTAVIAHYEFNLRRMVQISRQANVPLLLINPVCNLRDSTPFKSEHRPALDYEQLKRWEALWSEARQRYGSQRGNAAALLEQAIAIDGMHAGLHYDLAQCYEALGRIPDARRHYLLAKDLDVCPLRILQPMNDIVLEVSRQTGTPLVDARQLFERLTPSGIAGHEWLVDHVHPSIRGHQVLGGELANEMVRLGLVRPAATWAAERERLFANHLKSLDTIYYFRGQQHLDSLSRWAEGRVMKERPQHPAASDQP